jgi:hypothetical protein
MRSARASFIVFGLTVMLAGCGSPGRSPGNGGGSVPLPGTITGLLVSQRSDGSDRTPIGRETIGVFVQPLIQGKPVQHPPLPITTSLTAADGTFAFHGLKPGRYFVTVAGPTPPPVAGSWVSVTRSHGATVLLVRCTDCAGPL